MVTCGPLHAKLQSPNKGRAPPGGRRFPWVLGLLRYFPVFEPGVEDFALGSKSSHRVKMEREKGQTKQNKTLEMAGRQNSMPLKLPSSDRADTSLYSLVGHIEEGWLHPGSEPFFVWQEMNELQMRAVPLNMLSM